MIIACTLSLCALEVQVRWHERSVSRDLRSHYSSRIYEPFLSEVVGLMRELGRDVGMLINCHPYILNHFLLLSFLHAVVEILRVGSRHEDYVISVQMIGREVGTMPHFALPYLVKSNVVVSNLERTEAIMKLMEASKGLT